MAPASSAARRSSRSSDVVTATIGTSAQPASARKRRMNSTPSSSGIFTSVMTRSGGMLGGGGEQRGGPVEGLDRHAFVERLRQPLQDLAVGQAVVDDGDGLALLHEGDDGSQGRIGLISVRLLAATSSKDG